MGPRLGMPQITMSRSAFGYHGNYIPAALGIMLFVGYYSIGVVLGARSMDGLVGLPYTPAAILVAALSIVIAIFGYNLLQVLGRWLTYLSLAVFLTITVMLLTHRTGYALPAASGGGGLHAWLIVCTIVFSYTVSWSIYASDYSRYLPASSSYRRMFGFAFGGIFTATSWMMIMGAGLAMLVPDGSPLAGFAVVLPTPVLKITLATFVIGALAHNAVNLYSGAMAALTCDLPASRSSVVVAGGTIGCLLAVVFGGPDFQAHFNTFLLLVSYFVMPWLAVLFIDFYWRHSAGRTYASIAAFYDAKGPFRGIRTAALTAFAAGLLASAPFMATDAYTGPLGRALGGIDVSYGASFLVAAAVYWTVLGAARRRLPSPHATVPRSLAR